MSAGAAKRVEKPRTVVSEPSLSPTQPASTMATEQPEVSIKTASLGFSTRSIASTAARGTSIVGYEGKALSTTKGLSIAGHRGFASTQDYGVSIVGTAGVAIVGLYGIAMGGEGSILSFRYWAGDDYAYAALRVSQSAIDQPKPGVYYSMVGPQLQGAPYLSSEIITPISFSNFQMLSPKQVIELCPRLEHYLDKITR